MSHTKTFDDQTHMQSALAMARRGLGSTAPNPSVGCVIVKDNRVVGRGHTQAGGRPHAEVVALSMAGQLAAGATAYVTLEPCAHHGKTPPCAEALVAAGVARVVIAIQDPDPRVAGRGVEILKSAGIDVTIGVCQAEATAVTAGFLSKVNLGRPLVTLKLATSLDGRIATHTGESKWITSDQARNAGHLLRAENDAMFVGSGTVLADDPELTCRLPGLEGKSPIRVVADSRLKLPLTAKLVRTARQVPTYIYCRSGVDSQRKRVFEDAGVKVIEVNAGLDGMVCTKDVLKSLGSLGVTRLLVEGGAHLAAGLLRANLVDRMVWFRAPKIIGGDGLPAFVQFGLDRLGDAPQFTCVNVSQLGCDICEIYEKS